ncbi:MAG: hypothetical protein RIS35_1318 [Pseudomonadota bacterium]|jgi:hypothetical protein
MGTMNLTRRWIAVAGLASALLAVGCAMLPPTVDAYRPLPIGATWTNSRTDTGSYGSGTTQETITFAERTWQGRPVVALEGRQGAIIQQRQDAKWLAIVSSGGRPLITYDPPLGFDYPIAVGRTWKTKHRVTNYMANRSVDIEATWTVEAYEEITVPAGTFKAFRVRYVDTAGNEDVYWPSPELDMVAVKNSQRRTAASAQGAGTRETVLVSHAIRK